MTINNSAKLNQWDYLVVTASNDNQAAGYENQLQLRKKLGLLAGIRKTLIVTDLDGKRVGSGGSTLQCLIEILNCESKDQSDSREPQEILKDLRVLIIHAGGDSKRLPAYGACGKIFCPVPGENDSPLNLTLFDRQLKTYLDLPKPSDFNGQFVITSGDVLLKFDPSELDFSSKGFTGVACRATPEQASRHGVFCIDENKGVRIYLQKPPIELQHKYGAINNFDQSSMDIGIINFDSEAAAELLRLFKVSLKDDHFEFSSDFRELLKQKGIDFYREICCAMGLETSEDEYIDFALQSGSEWEKEKLSEFFKVLSNIKFSAELVKSCEFLDFGNTKLIIDSGRRLIKENKGQTSVKTVININNNITDNGSIAGAFGWVEGCRINSSLKLNGENYIVGADINTPVELSKGICVDINEGKSNEGDEVSFVKIYGIYDDFKNSVQEGIKFCGHDFKNWLSHMGVKENAVWDGEIPAEFRSLWNAKIFPAVKNNRNFADWLWMADPFSAEKKHKKAWKKADRYSFKEIALLTDYDKFSNRRINLKFQEIRGYLNKLFRPESNFSSDELSFFLEKYDNRLLGILEIIEVAKEHYNNIEQGNNEALIFPRVIYSLADALGSLTGHEVFGELGNSELFEDKLHLIQWLQRIGLEINPKTKIQEWIQKAKDRSFQILESAIITGTISYSKKPENNLRSDEIVWSRAPARLDISGGWTDTPPYTLENGGCVLNIAVNLNGQPPIQAYARVIEEPVIKIGSIDLGKQIRIETLQQLMDYKDVASGFSLAKAAFAFAGFSPNANFWRDNLSLKQMLEEFGGGIELTTLAVIPKGSGLGTSSIMGAVILSAISKVVGLELTKTELFNSVLALEQALTTGGGWQDQIGGVISGAKLIKTDPGFVPDPMIKYIIPDVIDPEKNNGCTLLYYTGITRLAKNILKEVVGKYLNRKRDSMHTLNEIYRTGIEASEAMSQKDLKEFGYLVDKAWKLNKKLDPNSSNREVEELMDFIEPYIYGAKLLGAGGGGFLLMVCKSPEHARKLKAELKNNQPNERARFFNMDISHTGLEVSVC